MTATCSKGKSDHINLLLKIPQKFSTSLRLKTAIRPDLILGSFYLQSFILSSLLLPFLLINSYSFFRSQFIKFTSLRKFSLPSPHLLDHVSYMLSQHSILSFIALTRTHNHVIELKLVPPSPNWKFAETIPIFAHNCTSKSHAECLALNRYSIELD